MSELSKAEDGGAAGTTYIPKKYPLYSRCRHCHGMMFKDDAEIVYCNCTPEDILGPDH